LKWHKQITPEAWLEVLGRQRNGLEFWLVEMYRTKVGKEIRLAQLVVSALVDIVLIPTMKLAGNVLILAMGISGY